MSPQSRTRGITIAATAILLFPAFSQTASKPPTSTGTSPTGAAPTGSTLPTIPSSTTGTTNTNTNPNSTTQTRVPQPIHVSGRVMVDDGRAPTSSVVIERVCNGSPHSEGYTDGDGYFSVQLGQNLAAIGDASETQGGFKGSIPQLTPTATGGSTGSGSGTGSSMGMDNRYANCDLRARLGGYRSQSISLANRGPLDNPDVGVILIHRLGESEEATTVTATTLRASKAARKAQQKGTDLAKKNKPEEAIASLQEAVRLDPEFALAWSQLGQLQMDNGHDEDAHQSFEAAAKAEPHWPDPYLHLALLGLRSRDWKEVADVTDRVLRLNSFEYPQAFFFNAVANYNLKHLEVAEKSARSAEKLDTRHQFPEVAHLLANILTAHHQYAEAVVELRSYLMLAPNAADVTAIRKQLEDTEQLALASSQVARKDQ